MESTSTLVIAVIGLLLSARPSFGKRRRMTSKGLLLQRGMAELRVQYNVDGRPHTVRYWTGKRFAAGLCSAVKSLR